MEKESKLNSTGTNSVKKKASKKNTSKKKVIKKSAKKKIVKKVTSKKTSLQSTTKKATKKKVSKKVVKKVSVKKSVKKKTLQKKPIRLKIESSDLDSYASHAKVAPSSSEALKHIQPLNLAQPDQNKESISSLNLQNNTMMANEYSDEKDSLMIKFVIVLFMSLAVIFYIRSLYVHPNQPTVMNQNLVNNQRDAEKNLTVKPKQETVLPHDNKQQNNHVQMNPTQLAAKGMTEKFPPPPLPIELPADQMQLIKETFAPEYFKQ